jgi:hypothetical protein
MIRAENLNSSILPSELYQDLCEHLQMEKSAADLPVREFLRFAKLSLLMPRKIPGLYRFIPVVPLIDKIWHFLILQTREYHEICEQLQPGKFLHHRTFLYERHMSINPKISELHQEDLSWLASYVDNFGDYSKEAVVFWRIPLLLMSELDWSLEKVNMLAYELILNSKS